MTDGDRVWVLTVDGRVRQLDARTAVARQLDLLEQHEAGAVLEYWSSRRPGLVDDGAISDSGRSAD